MEYYFFNMFIKYILKPDINKILEEIAQALCEEALFQRLISRGEVKH